MFLFSLLIRPLIQFFTCPAADDEVDAPRVRRRPLPPLGADERRRKETREKLRQSRGKSTSQTLGNFGVSGRIFARFRDPPTPRRAATGTRETNDERHD